MSSRCNNCFKSYDSSLEICPYCGFEDGEPATEPYFLYPGMTLKERYVVGMVLGYGGFGITYKAWDKNLNTVVAIKEYYYTGVSFRQPGTQNVTVYAQSKSAEYKHFLRRFLDEARYTAKFSKNPNIVSVYEFFEENSTAYMVMEFLEGTTLSDYLKHSTMNTEQCITVIRSLCSALKTVHAEGVIHRDVSPDNIYLCLDGKVKLIDFGAARFSKNQANQITKYTKVMKPGFSPPEQYQSVSEQGPWTDIYALGATFYYMITGIKPIESTNRKIKDTLAAPKELKPEIPDHINDTILRAMAVDMHLRFAQIDEFEKALNKEKKVLDVDKEKKRRRKKRLIGLLAASIVLIVGASAAIYQFIMKKEEVVLPESKIGVWYLSTGDTDKDKIKQKAFDVIIEEFNKGYPQVTIKLTKVSQNSFNNEWSEAAKKGTLPCLFESTGVDVSRLPVQSLSGVLRLVKKDDFVYRGILEELAEKGNKIALGLVVPVKFINESATESALEEGESEKDRFLREGAKVYIGSTEDYSDVRNTLPGLYSTAFAEDMDCSLADLWSIGEADSDQLKCVNQLLAFFLSNKTQTILYVNADTNYAQAGIVPLERKALETYEGLYKKDLKDIIDAYLKEQQ